MRSEAGHLPDPAPATSGTSRSYTDWARAALAELVVHGASAYSLFESSVPEPTELLGETLAGAFGRRMTRRYESAFLGGNPFVVRQLQHRYGVDARSILCTTGASSALSLAYRAFLRPGDHVLVENPGFDLFAVLAEGLGIAVDRFERHAPDFALDPALVAAKLGPRTRLVVCSNLHNPTGTLADAGALREIGNLVRQRNALVVVDEVYGDYAGPGFQPAASLGNSILSVSSLTKIYGLSTLRCGWAIGSPDVIAPVRSEFDNMEFGVSKLAHAVAALVLENPAPYDRYWKGMLAESRPVMQEYHDRWVAEGRVSGSLPEHGCICFPRLVAVDDTMEFSRLLARGQGVYVAPGECFGMRGHVRIGYALPAERLREALSRFDSALRERG